MPIINSRKDTVKDVSKKTPKKNIKTLARSFALASNFDTTGFIKVGTVIRAEWKIRNKLFWWRAEVIKAKRIGIGFGKPCRIYTLKYASIQFYPRGKIMEQCFIDDQRLYDITEDQLVSYYVEEGDGDGDGSV